MELFSKAEDCHKLAGILNSRLKNKISFMGSTYQEVVSGVHSSFPLADYQNIKNYEMDKINFDYKYCEKGFLRISISKRIYETTLGHKLAVLSDFYMVLIKYFGEPTLLYTIKNDDEESINMQWSFAQREEDIKDFQNNKAFDDAEIESLIIFDKNKTEEEILIQCELELPIELASLVRENLSDYIYYKNGRMLNAYEQDTFPTLRRKMN